MNQIAKIQKAPLVAGHSVGAIIPQTIEEMWRVAEMVVIGGLAPYSMTAKKDHKAQVSAVATCIMAGAELALPPMVALRSFTVINGRPALYAEGLIGVCRQSGNAEYIRSGYDREKEIGWCEAKRSDTGEESRVEFTKQDAIDAGLWDDRAEVERYNKYDKKKEIVPNDAPWFRYKPRMMKWRAVGYCLRDLFADALGGVPTVDEAEEIARIEHEPSSEPTPPNVADLTPPPPPDSHSGEPLPASEPVDVGGADSTEDDLAEIETPEEIFKRAKAWFGNCQTQDDLLTAWEQFMDLDLGDDDAMHLQSLFDEREAFIKAKVLGA